MLASGARDVIAIGAKIGKAVIGGLVKTAIKIAGKDAAKDASEAAAKGISSLIDDAIKEIPENTKNHILNGTKSARKDTTAGHSWEALFDGEKPDFDKVEPFLKKAYEDGKCTSQEYNIGKGKTMIKNKYTTDVDGKEVWLETAQVNGKLTIVDGGVNIK